MGSFCFTLVVALLLLLEGGLRFGVDASTYHLAATSSLQYFTSRNYPNNYDPSSTDEWIIDSGGPSLRVRIDILDASVESHSTCSFDYFRLYDGSSPLSPSYGEFCGTLSSCYFESSGRYARLDFHTDSNTASRGFRMSYQRVSGTTPNAVSTCPVSSSSSGSSSGSSGSSGFPSGVTGTTRYLSAQTFALEFTSLHYPFNYLHNTDDQWIIDSQSTLYRIHVDVIDSSLESIGTRCYDYFQFRDGFSNGASSPRYCGSWNSCYFESSGRYATISLVSDSSHAYRGFKMSYYRVFGTRSSAVTTCTNSLTSTHTSTSTVTPFGSPSLSSIVFFYRSGAASFVPSTWGVSCAIAAVLLGLVG